MHLYFISHLFVCLIFHQCTAAGCGYSHPFNTFLFKSPSNGKTLNWKKKKRRTSLTFIHKANKNWYHFFEESHLHVLHVFICPEFKFKTLCTLVCVSWYLLFVPAYENDHIDYFLLHPIITVIESLICHSSVSDLLIILMGQSPSDSLFHIGSVVIISFRSHVPLSHSCLPLHNPSPRHKYTSHSSGI